ncbi:MAG: DinB family protein [Gemmataceae bacterium]|nr:DinB family protein [Gemmataceae bacterium]
MTPTDPTLILLLRLVDEGFDRPAWHGPNLRGSLRRVDAAAAAFRPAPGRKSIWEHAVHAAYWKYTVRRRLTGEKRGSFALDGSNWFARPDPAVGPAGWDEAWRADLALLDETHRSLRAAVAATDPAALGGVTPGGKVSTVRVIHGAVMHDVYHAGQIALLKRLAAGASVPAASGRRPRRTPGR